jgi:glycosyltransferase involved in cell wall biosynthesis
MSDFQSDKPLRILHVVESAATGVARHVLDLADGASRAGHATDVIYSPLREDDLFRKGRERLEKQGVAFHAVPMRRDPGPWDLSTLSNVRGLVRRYGPFGVIHGHSSKGGMLARLAGVGGSGAVVYTPHAISTQDPMLGGVKRMIFKFGEKALARLTDRIIAVSSAECEHIVSLGIPRAKLAVIPNGVGRPTGPTRAQARATLGLANDNLAIGFVGRLSRQKGVDVMIAGFAHVAKADPGARLVMIGEGEGGAIARAMAESVGCAKQIIWLGMVDALQYFPAFDLFAQPSRYEGFSYAILEAASHGIPALTTDVGGSRETITEGVTGMIVPPDQPVVFAEALLALTGDRARLASMRRVAADIAGKVDGRERMVDATLALYHSLLLRPKAGVKEVEKAHPN